MRGGGGINDTKLIFGMHDPFDNPFQLTPFKDLDLHLWPTSRSKLLPGGGPQLSEFACNNTITVSLIFMAVKSVEHATPTPSRDPVTFTYRGTRMSTGYFAFATISALLSYSTYHGIRTDIAKVCMWRLYHREGKERYRTWYIHSLYEKINSIVTFKNINFDNLNILSTPCTSSFSVIRWPSESFPVLWEFRMTMHLAIVRLIVRKNKRHTLEELEFQGQLVQWYGLCLSKPRYNRFMIISSINALWLGNNYERSQSHCLFMLCDYMPLNVIKLTREK